MVGRIVTIASSKGGVGKTCLSILIANRLATRDYVVGFVDADPNLSISSWIKIYKGPIITCIAETRDDEIVDVLQHQASDHQVVIADTAGFNNRTAAFAAATAHVVLIPVMPDRASLVEAMRTAKQVENFSKAAGRKIPFFLVLMRWNPKGLVEQSLKTDIDRVGLHALSQPMSASSNFGKLSVTGMVPKSGKMVEQADALIDELIALGVLQAQAMETV